MKHICNLLFGIGLLLVTSCSSEENTASTQAGETKKELSPEMEDFRAAMIDWAKSKHNQNAFRTSQESKSILAETSRALLESNGIQLEKVEGKQALSEEELLSIAMRLYAEKTRLTLNQQP